LNYLLDTNVISEVRKGGKCNPHVARWYDSIDDTEIFLSVLVLGEIRKGIERARPNDPTKARALEKWLAEVTTGFADRILPIDRAIADQWGRMSAKRPLPTVDALLAATAKVHRLTLATRNIAHVADLGADLYDPFEPRVGSL
jgi:predicted nucleic acid-binding protein